jgi:isoleucyl-tRNA synthetase
MAEEDEKRAASAEKSATAAKEEEILAFWNREKIFEKSLSKKAPKGEFVFYDGPPFATGLPHYGHILPGSIKDAIPRYKTMQGYHVRRRWGWDCHGLPLENQIEKELGLATKRDIEKLGVAKFNAAARDAVLRYADEWRRIVPRFGRFVDMEDDYRTMDATYTESVWWAFKRLWDKGLVYEGFKAMHLCPRCGTTLSNFEVAQGYKDSTDLAVTVKLPLVDEPGTFLLVWTTTPWTLPGNMAAAVNASETYVKVKIGEEFYIVAKARNTMQGEVVAEFKGSELVGKRYTPPFPYFTKHQFENKERAWKVYHAPYVTMEDGTGLVHLAPAFGAEDLELAQKEKIPIVHHVNKDGMFVDAITDFKGLQAKPKDNPQATDVAIIKYLAAKGLLFAKEKITHSYPHCWRCDTPLLNYAASSWFVSVTKFADKLVAENKKIRWVPNEVGEKRFGNWLENARDWAISRARYWGAPIPVWRNPKTKELTVIGSLDDLKKYTKKSGNRYFVMRHGEAESNIKDVLNSTNNPTYHLTKNGEAQVRASAEKIKGMKIDFIITSPLVRTQETAAIVREILGMEGSVIIDERFKEDQFGIIDGKPVKSFYDTTPSVAHWVTHAIEGGESYIDVKHRVAGALYEYEKTYQNKTILIVTHDDPAMACFDIVRGRTSEEIAVSIPTDEFFEKAETRELPFVPLPHNADYELDLHRPYIDEIALVAEDGTRLERVHDVFDCWFESGSMSYAQDHYPFANKDLFDPEPGLFRKSRGYPADFIAEGLDQTRGWFYSLLVLGVALFGRAPYKNVIVNGTILDETGTQKLSKKLQNYPDPLYIINRYGADAVRYYLISSPAVHGEDLSFSEKGVAEVASKLVGRLTNVLSFYEMYKEDTGAVSGQSQHILDRWILVRLSETIATVEAGMDAYQLDRAARPLMDFVEDLSTWYLRRSRERFREDATALATFRIVLRDFSKILAPFTPFVADQVYRAVRSPDDLESVHLAEWPRPKRWTLNAKLLRDMAEVRRICSLALEARQKAGIKVRQPLQKLTADTRKLKAELLELIKDEVNVKEVAQGEFILDTAITEELKKEGEARDILRAVQDMRKVAGLAPKDRAVLAVSAADAAYEMHVGMLMKSANIERMEKGDTTHVRKM